MSQYLFIYETTFGGDHGKCTLRKIAMVIKIINLCNNRVSMYNMNICWPGVRNGINLTFKNGFQGAKTSGKSFKWT